MRKLQLVLPCYNESKSLQAIIERAKKAALEVGLNQNDFQLIMVENGSRDNSREIFAKLEKSELSLWFKMIPIDVNQGYGFGLYAGLKSTDAAVVAWSHADQQCDPSDVFKAYQLYQLQGGKGKVFIKGKRKGRNWKDAFVSRVFKFFSHIILGSKIDEINAQPKLFPRELLNQLSNPPKDFSFDLYVLYQAQKNAYSFLTVDVLFPPRIHGFSNWSSNFFSRYKTILNMIKYMLYLAKESGRL